MSLKSFSELPGPWGMPIVGSLASLATYKEKVLMHWAENYYGPVFRFKMGSKQAVALQGFDAIKEALVDKAESFSGRIECDVISNVRGNKGIFFVDYGPAWKIWRSFATEQLTAVWDTSLNGILKETQHFKIFLGDSVGNPIDLSDALKLFMMNGILQTCFSKRLEISEPKTQELYANVYGAINHPKFAHLMCLPWLRYLPPYKTFLENLIHEREQVAKKITALIAERREEQRTTPDLVTCFDQTHKENLEENMESFVMFIEDLLFAGSATTANQLLWAILLLLKHSSCMTKLRTEIDKSFSGERNPGQAAVAANAPELNYLKAVLQETYRYRPIAPTSLLHATSVNSSVMGYEIPMGTTVIPNLWSVHHDKDHWKPDPDTFRPERHLDESGKFVKSDRVMSFSTGWRHCVGKKIAETEIMVHLVTLLAHFNIELADESVNVDVLGVSESLLKPTSFKVILSLRE